MRDKWVDTHGYFGPDRRQRSGSKRWKERRTLDEAGKPPALGAMLRRLRVLIMDLSTLDDRRRALQLLSAAIVDAERLHFYRCADALKQADHALRLGGEREARTIDSRLNEAIDFAGAQQ